MLRFFAGHPTAANLFMLLFLIGGMTFIPGLKKETFPTIHKYEMQVRVVYPGADPRDVEDAICRPIEDAITRLMSLRKAQCESRNGIGLMTLTMEPRGDFNLFKDDIRTAIDGIDNFPAAAEPPIIEELGRTQAVVTLAITIDDGDLLLLKDLAEQFQEEMLLNPDIPLVSIDGFSQRELRIRLEADALRRYGLSVQDVAQRVTAYNKDLPLGTLLSQDKEYNLSFDDERVTPEQLQQLVILSAANGAQVTLGDMAKIDEFFELPEQYITFDGLPAALLKVEKNTDQDSLKVLAAVEKMLEQKQRSLPDSVRLHTTQDMTSLIVDRLTMLTTNAWQGLILVFATLLLFFKLRYSFWVVMGLPVSFMASFFFMSVFGISINMISMVSLLLAIGILMDDAIVISESIASRFKAGDAPLDAAINGTKRVSRGVLSSFATTVLIFGSMIALQGDLGQVLRAIPIVLLIVISISLIEAFFILPSHLHHTMAHSGDNDARGIRLAVERGFDRLRERLGNTTEWAMQRRYAVVGATVGLFFISISLLVGGVLKFQALPKLDGDVLQARITMPTGTPLNVTKAHVDQVLTALNAAIVEMEKNESEPLLRHITVTYGQNRDAFEEGAHLATISADLRSAEVRNAVLDDLIAEWLQQLPAMPEMNNLVLTEPALGPSGRAIEFHLSGLPLNQLQLAAGKLQDWLNGYPGVYAVFSDLRAGKPELSLTLKPEAIQLGISADEVASQLRAAYFGIDVNEIYRGLDQLDIVVELQREPYQSLETFESFPFIHPKTGERIPLLSIVNLKLQRDYSRINRWDRRQTVSVFGSVNSSITNTGEVVSDTVATRLKELQEQMPGLRFQVEGEVANGAETAGSLRKGFLFGLMGVFILLSLQFRSYSEPLIVMLAIPLSLIGVIWGHLIMGHNLAMPSMVGFVSLAGIVVNNSILLVEFVKLHTAKGVDLHTAAKRASQERLRAIVLTTTTTVAGMLPLLFETSLQAQILIPLVISITFGLLVSSLLILLVVPCFYGLLEDWQKNRQR